ncbi:zf-HC2 domain-containing protein [Micromonospora sp. NPDC047527]|uniref:zf-HC2 domain-containing protein n=1 Tax=Micromonospora sp. NPDC047527 TaxID=3155144 RepID=UPI003407D2C9
MRTGEENPTAEHATLARYLLGALDEAERVAFEAHLAGCWECLSAAGQMGSVTSALPELDAADWEAIASLPPDFALPEFVPPTEPDTSAVVRPTEPDTSAVAPPASGPTLPPGGLAVEREAGPPEPSDDPPGATACAPAGPGADVTRRRNRRGGAGPRTVGSARPAGSRPGTPAAPESRPGRPSSDPRRRRLKLWAGAAAAVLAVVIAGGGVVAGLGPTNSDVVLTANGEAPAQGVSLAVTITTDQDRSSIKVTAIGLRPGLRYRLFGVTRDGATHVIRDWTASSGPQDVAAELSLPVNDLAFVTVGLVDGTAIVTAPISR